MNYIQSNSSLSHAQYAMDIELTLIPSVVPIDVPRARERDIKYAIYGRAEILEELQRED
jgi:hypothetical protein